MTLPAGARVGPYEIVAPIGAGGMGEVYRARDTRLDRDVAVKILPDLFAKDPERLARFEREAKTLASLNHPNIAQIYGLEASAQITALAMELVDGDDLSALIARGPVPIDEALPIARQIADALAAAHERGIIHRDLKPANIKLRVDGVVKVLDFGLAKAVDAAGRDFGPGSDLMNSPTITSPATQFGVILGTAAYMPPEQAKGRAVDRRADVWSFGVVLYEMLTGRRAFGGADVSEVLASVLKDAPSNDALPAATPLAIRRLLRHCLVKDPAGRLDSMAAARIEIDEAMAGRAEDGGVARPPRLTPRRAMAAVAAIVILLAAGVAVGSKFTSVPVVERPLARFGIPLPQEQTLGSFVRPSLAISADGRRIVYRTNRAIFVRDLNDVEPRQVTQASGAGVWISPDGEWVLFGTPSGLSKVQIAGGRPQEQAIVASADISGADWSADGTIVYGTTAALSRMPAGGGTPVEITRAAQGGAVSWPQQLPGGRLLFTRWTVQTGAPGPSPDTVTSAMDGSGERVVLKGVSARYVEPGVLIYGRENQLHAVPFDVSRAETRGAEFVIPETVLIAEDTRWAQIAVGGGTAAFVPRRFTLNQTQLLWADQGGRTSTAMDVARVYSDPRISPDGRRIALHLWDDENDVWVGDLARGTLTRATFSREEEETPVWSPDGREIAYAAARGPGNPRALLTKAADGGTAAAERVVWTDPDHFHVTDWSADGRTILVEIRRSATSNDVLAIDVQAGTARPVAASSFRELQARFSPDGRWIAFTSNESGRADVYAMPFPALDRRVTVSTAGGVEPVWARDGKRLYFRTVDQIMAASVTPASSLEFAPPQRLFADSFARPQGDSHTHFDVDQTGRFLFIAGRGQAPQRESEITVVVNWVEQLRRLAAGPTR